jgi:hypothetical protein
MALGARGHEVVDGYVWLEENRPGLGPARPALLVLTNELLMKKPVLSKQIRTVYAHICVD